MNLLLLCVFRMSSLCSLLYFLNRSVEAICWTFPQLLTYQHQEQKNNHVAAGSLFAATHRHLFCHCEVSSRCHAVPFSFLPSCPHTFDAVACPCINNRGNRWVFLPGSECCVSPGVSMSGWRHVHCTFDEFTHTRGTLTLWAPLLVTEALSEANYVVNHLKKNYARPLCWFWRWLIGF